MAIITTGKYLKHEDVTEEGSVHKIVSVAQESLRTSDGETELKWLLTLDSLKPLVLNATNIRRCVAAFNSQDTDDWIGQRIIVYDDPTVEFGGKIVGGIRLKAAPKAAGGKRKVTPVPAADEDVDVSDIPL